MVLVAEGVLVAAAAGGDKGRVGNMVPESDRPRFG